MPTQVRILLLPSRTTSKPGLLMRRVSEVMRSPAVVVSPGDTIQHASARMLDAGVHAAVVSDHGEIAGLVTAERVARALGEGFDSTHTLVELIADQDPLILDADTPLAEAHQRMRATAHAVAAVVVGGEPIGVLEDPEAPPAT